jgi:hypothetical protein
MFSNSIISLLFIVIILIIYYTFISITISISNYSLLISHNSYLSTIYPLYIYLIGLILFFTELYPDSISSIYISISIISISIVFTTSIYVISKSFYLIHLSISFIEL